MKQFNLEEYLKNPSRKIVTKLGRNARIICTDRADSTFPIVALIESKWGESTTVHTKDGKYFLNDASDCDLFFAPEKQERWINLFENPNPYQSYRMPIIANELLYKTKDEAEEVGNSSDGYIRTVKIEWEE